MASSPSLLFIYLFVWFSIKPVAELTAHKGTAAKLVAAKSGLVIIPEDIKVLDNSVDVNLGCAIDQTLSGFGVNDLCISSCPMLKAATPHIAKRDSEGRDIQTLNNLSSTRAECDVASSARSNGGRSPTIKCVHINAHTCAVVWWKPTDRGIRHIESCGRDVSPLLLLERLFRSIERGFRGRGSTLRSLSANSGYPVGFKHGLPLVVSYAGISYQRSKSQHSDPKCPPLNSVGFIVLGVIAVTYFWWKVYFGADPLRWSGWGWFLGLLLSLGILGYGFDLFLDCVEDLYK